MARLVCMSCGKDLGPSETTEDSHGVCIPCGARLTGRTVEEFVKWTAELKRKMERQRAERAERAS